MRKNTFCPSLNDALEDRLVLSHVGALALVHVAHARPTPPTAGHPVLKSAILNDVNQKIDVAFARFNSEYKKEIGTVDRNGDENKFDIDLAASTARLKTVLAKQAARIPGGKVSLTPTLNARVDSLVHDLATQTTRSSNDLVSADKAGTHADVLAYVHDAASKGDISMK